MERHVLPEGTILNERYRIDALLGEGGFGITYAAHSVSLELKVAIKELFWRGHSARDASASPQVSLASAEDAAVFQEQKERFLREARMIRDFSSRSNIAHVLDYFEANGTAYIVMEYVEGQTLSAYIAQRGPMPGQELFERFLPLAESLGFVHRSGVIHRDISPDNIMVQPDGSLKLIDFGAAREYSAPKVSSVVVKVSYAPPEQHDRKGKLGPWTDVYSLCATLYYCVTGRPPVDSIQRMFVDELSAPSELRPGIEPRCEAVILRGMELIASKRWQSMEELAAAMREALPRQEASGSRTALPRALLIAVALLLCATLALGYGSYRRYRREHRFDGVDTETFFLTAPEDMSVRDFSRAQGELSDALNGFAGEGNYIASVEGSRLRVELPLALFEDRDIGEALGERLKPQLDAYSLKLEYQIQAEWDDPAASPFSGRNQVRPEEFDRETAIFTYKISDEHQTSGQRANLLMDFKARLDALGTPYAFGTAYGNPNVILFRIDPGPIGRFVTETIGSLNPLSIAGESSGNGISVTRDFNGGQPLRVVDNGDGSFGLRFEKSSSAQELQAITEGMLRQGMRALYLQTSDGLPLAKILLDAPVTDGALVFRDFLFEGLERIDAAHRYILDYLAALVNESDLPAGCYRNGEGIWDARDGISLRLDESVEDRFGLRTLRKDGEYRLEALIQRLEQETGYACNYSNGTFWIALGLQADEHLIENIAEIVPGLLREYPFSEIIYDSTVVIQLMDEPSGERYRIFLNTGVDWLTQNCYHYAWALFTNRALSESPDESVPYAAEFQAWWDDFPLEEYGFERERL